MIKKLFVLKAILLVIVICTTNTMAQLPKKDFRTFLINLKNTHVLFFDGTPPGIIDVVEHDYFIVKTSDKISTVIPFNSISKIEIIGDKKKTVTIYLIYSVGR